MMKQFSKFIVIGIISTIINYTVFYLLLSVFSFHYLLSASIGFLSGVLAGFRFNKTWTFEVTQKRKRYLMKYLTTYTISLGLGLCFLEFLVQGLDIIPEVANIITIALTTCTNFIGTKFWVFQA